jgi:Domain of unknown function (DUF4365)
VAAVPADVFDQQRAAALRSRLDFRAGSAVDLVPADSSEPFPTGVFATLLSRMKKLTNSDMIGKAGISLVGLRLAEIGFLFHETGAVEAGTDGFVELRDPSSGQMLSTVFRLQSKATRNGRAWQRETEASFEYPCKERDIADWVASNVPVVLVCSDVARQIAFWKDVTAYFRSPDRRADRRVIFDKRTDAFDQSAAAPLAAVAIPRGAGISIPPPVRTEELLSNLLPVIDHPDSLWVAPALVSEMWEVEEVLRDAGIGVECFVRGGQLFSFRQPEELEWEQVCDTAGAERFAASEWAESEKSTRQHEFAELLRRALGEKVRDMMDYDRREKLFYFRAPADLSDVRLPSGRRVFAAYHKRDGGIRYYRHLGFRGQFHRLDGDWYLEINPDYRFTRDGHAVSKFQADNNAKMKRIERNDAVRQQIRALATFLNRPATLLTPEYRFLSFGPPLCFQVPFGFDEGAWLNRDQKGDDGIALFDVA